MDLAASKISFRWKLICCRPLAVAGLGAFLFLLGGLSHLAAAEQNTSRNKLRLREINITGNHEISEKEIRKILKLKINKPTNPDKIQQAFDRLQNAYIDKGFFKVQFTTSIATTPSEITASLEIVEGPLFHVRSVRVQGNQEISEKNIRREMELKSGDIFSPAKLIQGNKRLYATGSFEIVDLAMSTAPESNVDVNIKVRERRQKFVKGGAGYGTETKERLSVGYEDQNFLGSARRADIKYTYSGFATERDKNETRSLEAGLIKPFAFGTRMEGHVSLEHARKFREAYDSIERNLHASLERRFRAAFSVRLNYRFEGTELTRVSPEAETPSVTSIDSIGTSLRYDNTDDPFLPRLGWRTIGSVEEGLRIFSNDVGFHKIEGRAGRFDTGEWGWTFFEGFQTGLLLPRSGNQTNSIPIDERFFLGGANTVRGYPERSLGPKDAQGAPLGGTFFLVTNFEVRHKIYKKIYGVMFVDAGNLFDYDPGDTNPKVQLSSLGDLAQGCGVGIRLHSPVGAIRLEGGYQINPEDSSLRFEDRTTIHFSIGEVF